MSKANQVFPKKFAAFQEDEPRYGLPEIEAFFTEKERRELTALAAQLF